MPNLRDIIDNPPNLEVSAASEVLASFNAQTNPNEPNQMTLEADSAADIIDWDITLDSAQIDWDIGIVEEDTGNGLGPYEIVDASEIPQSSLNDYVESDEINKVNTVSEISWDISVDHPEVELTHDNASADVYSGEHTSGINVLNESQRSRQVRSRLLETEYRSRILDDLFEV